MKTAAACPDTLVVGLDANAAGMADASRRAARRPASGGWPNAFFVVAAAESLPSELEGAFDEVTVHFPWGSLLRGLVTCDGAIVGGLARVLKPGGSLRILLSITEREATTGLDRLTPEVLVGLARGYACHGFELIQGEVASSHAVAASHSTWAKRLGPGRVAWLLIFGLCKGVIETGDGRDAGA